MGSEIIRGLLALGLIITINMIEFIESRLEKRKYNIKRVVVSCSKYIVFLLKIE